MPDQTNSNVEEVKNENNPEGTNPGSEKLQKKETALSEPSQKKVTEEMVNKPPVSTVEKKAQEETNKTNQLMSAVVGKPLEKDSKIQILLDVLERYKENMAPGVKIDQKNGVANQKYLWAGIKNLLNSNPRDFEILWNELLNFVHVNRDHVFHDSKIFRFWDKIDLTSKELNNFSSILNLLISTADPTKRKLVVSSKQINLKTTLEKFSEEIKQKIESFYSSI